MSPLNQHLFTATRNPKPNLRTSFRVRAFFHSDKVILLSTPRDKSTADVLTAQSPHLPLNELLKPCETSIHRRRQHRPQPVSVHSDNHWSAVVVNDSQMDTWSCGEKWMKWHLVWCDRFQCRFADIKRGEKRLFISDHLHLELSAGYSRLCGESLLGRNYSVCKDEWLASDRVARFTNQMLFIGHRKLHSARENSSTKAFEVVEGDVTSMTSQRSLHFAADNCKIEY